MEKRDTLTKILATTGTVLVWLPILAPILFSLIRFVQAQKFLFDYLMPAELFPLALAGGALLLWAALRARSRRGLIGWGLGVAVVLLIGGQQIAILSGLASGETAPEGAWWLAVLATLGAYSLCLILIGIGGGLLLRDLFRGPKLLHDG